MFFIDAEKNVFWKTVSFEMLFEIFLFTDFFNVFQGLSLLGPIHEHFFYVVALLMI